MNASRFAVVVLLLPLLLGGCHTTYAPRPSYGSRPQAVAALERLLGAQQRSLGSGIRNVTITSTGLTWEYVVEIFVAYRNDGTRVTRDEWRGAAIDWADIREVYVREEHIIPGSPIIVGTVVMRTFQGTESRLQFAADAAVSARDVADAIQTIVSDSGVSARTTSATEAPLPRLPRQAPAAQPTSASPSSTDARFCLDCGFGFKEPSNFCPGCGRRRSR